MIQLVKKTFRKNKDPSGTVERTAQRPVGGTGESIGMFRESLFGLAVGFTACRCQLLSPQWLSASLMRKITKRCGKGPIGTASGLTWTHGMLCVCAHHPASGTCRRAN